MAGQTKLPAANTLPNNYCTFLVTGRDIIFFWIARMMLFNVFYTNKTLFENIIIHGLVRDQQGRKMSKSLGNGINPLVMIDRYGNDSLRLFLLTATTPGLDINFNDQKIISYYHFLNKLWNAIKFVRYYCLTDREIYLYLATTRNNIFEIATIFGVVRYDNV